MTKVFFCLKCKGSGKINTDYYGNQRCFRCGGTGRIEVIRGTNDEQLYNRGVRYSY